MGDDSKEEIIAENSPTRIVSDTRLERSESFGPVKLRKNLGEILLSRYQKVSDI